MRRSKNFSILDLKCCNQNLPFSSPISICSVRANKITIGKTPIDRLLTLDTEQVINANVTIHGNVSITNGSAVEINHLLTNNRIFGIDLQTLLDDCYFVSPNESIVITSPKWFANVTIDQLVVEGDFWQVGQTLEEIQQRLQDLETELTISGPITFNNQFTIKNLTVIGAINDIPSERFGKEWLLLEGAQVSESNCSIQFGRV